MRLVDAEAIIQNLPYSPEEMSITSVLSQEKPKYITPTVMMVRSVISIIQNTPTATPWVKTSDRLPTKEDADNRLEVLAWDYCAGVVVKYGDVKDNSQIYPYWMPIPPMPEVTE